jgi:hypothetical protein
LQPSVWVLNFIPGPMRVLREDSKGDFGRGKGDLIGAIFVEL